MVGDTRMIRLFDVVLHAGATVAEWRAAQLQSRTGPVRVTSERKTLNQLRHGLWNLKARGLLAVSHLTRRLLGGMLRRIAAFPSPEG